MRLKYKIYFFVEYFSLGILGPYLAVYLYQRAFSGIEIGLILGSMPIIMFIFQPLWSYLSDVLNSRRLVLTGVSLGVVAAVIGFGASSSFLMAFLWAVLLSAMRAPIGPVSNAIVLDYLEETDQLEDFSLIRLWGSLAFAISSLLLGSFFLNQILVYFTWFIAGLYFLLAILGLFLPEKGAAFSYSGFKGLGHLLKNQNFVFFLLGSVFIGATFGISMNYLTLFLQSLAAPSWLIGSTISLQALVEVPIMIMVPFLLHRFSMRRLILFGGLILPLRWLIYVFIQSPAWVLPTQIIHGLAIVSFLVVGVSFIDHMVDPKFRATGQGLYMTALNGIGAGLGVYLAGAVFEWFDIRAVWLLNTLLGLIGFVLLVASLHRLKSQSQSNGQSRPPA